MFIASNRPEILTPLKERLRTYYGLQESDLVLEVADEQYAHLLLVGPKINADKIRKICGFCDGWIAAWYHVQQANRGG